MESRVEPHCLNIFDWLHSTRAEPLPAANEIKYLDGKSWR